MVTRGNKFVYTITANTNYCDVEKYNSYDILIITTIMLLYIYKNNMLPNSVCFCVCMRTM